jgi:hypothetical protein
MSDLVPNVTVDAPVPGFIRIRIWSTGKGDAP